MSITDEQYVLLTTFKRDGTAVATPIWIAAVGEGKAGFWTGSDTGKVKRLRHSSRVLLQPSDARGRVKPGSQQIEATGTVVTGAELEVIRKQIVAKYGFMTKITRIMRKLMGYAQGKNFPYADCGVLITL
jgi:PPOX class probable F420-dependent enzyme